VSDARAEKRVAVSSSPLCNTRVLKTVLAYSEGLGLHVNAVCKTWKACFKGVVEERQSTSNRYHRHSSSCTRIEAVFASLETVAYAHACGLRYGGRSAGRQRIQEHAGQYADTATLHKLYEMKLPMTEHVVTGALRSKDLPKVIWLCEDVGCTLPPSCTGAAAEAGSVELLQWLKQQGCEFDEHASYKASRTPHNIPVLQFLSAEGCPWHKDVCCNSAEAGDLEQLQWLHQHGAALSNETAGSAACNGGIHLMEWLVQQPGVQLEPELMQYAAAYGHLELCKWLHAAGCPCEEVACEMAAKNSKLSTLRYLHESVCPAGADTWRSALLYAPDSNTEVLQYLTEHVVLTEADDLCDALDAAGEAGALIVALHLLQQGAEWPVHLEGWSDELIAWARAEGCTAPEQAPDDDGEGDSDSGSD
jgi:hypothetical protein